MTKPSKKLLAPIVALGAVPLVAIGGSASASAAGGRAGGRVHVYEVAPSLSSNVASVVATGAITDYGTNYQGVAGGGTINKIVFSKGDIEVSTAGLTGKPPTVDPRTCSFKRSLYGTVPIVTGGGTGAYVRASGTFQVTIKVVGILPVLQSGGCDETAPPVAGISWVRGVGTVSLN